MTDYFFSLILSPHWVLDHTEPRNFLSFDNNYSLVYWRTLITHKCFPNPSYVFGPLGQIFVCIRISEYVWIYTHHPLSTLLQRETRSIHQRFLVFNGNRLVTGRSESRGCSYLPSDCPPNPDESTPDVQGELYLSDPWHLSPNYRHPFSVREPTFPRPGPLRGGSVVPTGLRSPDSTVKVHLRHLTSLLNTNKKVGVGTGV